MNAWSNLARLTGVTFFLALCAYLLTPSGVSAQNSPAGLEIMPITKNVRLAPGEHYAVKIEAETGKLTFPSEKEIVSLPAETVDVINECPAWTRDALTDNFRELLLDRIRVKENSRVATGDLNGDGRADLVVGGAHGELRAFLAPFWSEDSALFKRLRLEGPVVPALGDVNGDGKIDLLLTSENKIRVYQGAEFKESFELEGAIENPDGLGYAAVGNEKYLWTRGHLFKLDGKKLVGDKKIAPEDFLAIEDVNADGKPDMARIDQDASLFLQLGGGEELNLGKLINISKIPSERKKTTSKYFPGGPVFCDVNNDGASDLVLGNANGEVYVVKNRGGKKSPLFLLFQRDPIVKFPDMCGLFASPAFGDINSDGKGEFVVGNQAGEIHVCTAPDWKDSEKLKITAGEYLRPALGDFNSDGKTDLIAGNKNGEVLFFLGPDWTLQPKLTIKLADNPPVENKKSSPDKTAKPLQPSEPPTYAAPALCDADNDGDLDLIIGANDGRLYSYVNRGTKQAPEFSSVSMWGYLEKSPKIFAVCANFKSEGASAPLVCDLNNDKIPDLLVGEKSGQLRLFLSPNYEESKGIFIRESVTSFASPCAADLNGDGKIDLVLGELDGQLTYLENVSENGKLSWTERFSWLRWKKGVDRAGGYSRYFRDMDFLLGATDAKTVKQYTDLLLNCRRELLDEIAYCVAATDPEILRTMARMDQAHLLEENARMIYHIAKEVTYAQLVEKGDITTIAYKDSDGKFYEAPPMIYYQWVVHPRVFWEVPLLIDASYWEKQAQYYCKENLDHLNYKPRPSVYEQNEKSLFWRSFMPWDISNKNNNSMMARLKKAKDFREALYAIHDQFASRETTGHMTFGFYTDDLDPMVIYKKQYGSCGEHSMLGAAVGRTALLPTSIMCKFAEDHMWNEVWFRGEWLHWDLCFPAMTGVECPWSGTEAFNHTGEKCSSVLRATPQGSLLMATHEVAPPAGARFTYAGKGYTDTSEVTVQVETADGQPVEGALIEVLSHWVPGGRLTTHDYTDRNGQALLRLGEENHGGYTFFAFTPFGSAAIKNYGIEEREKYTVKLIVPGKNPLGAKRTQLPEKILPNLSLKLNSTREYSFPPHYHTSARWIDKEEAPYLFQKTGYMGQRFCREDYKNVIGPKTLLLDEKNYALYQDGLPAESLSSAPAKGVFHIVIDNRDSLFSFNRTNVTFTSTAPVEKPKLTAALAPGQILKMNSGEPCNFEGTASDNLGLKTFSVSLNNDSEFHSAQPVFSGDKWKLDLREAVSGPIPPGTYNVCFKVEDFGGQTALSESFKIEIAPVRVFNRQVIRQDNPAGPLPKSSWMLGPFKIDKGERALEIEARCASQTDIDLFLYYDANGNLKLDGEGELFDKSATPDSTERIMNTNLKPGYYWIYCHGFKVPKGLDHFDISISLAPKTTCFENVGPVGFCKDKRPEFFASINAPTGFDGKSLKITLDGSDITSSIKLEGNRLSLKTETVPNWDIESNPVHAVVLSVKDSGGNLHEYNWNFEYDSKPPVIQNVTRDFTTDVGGPQEVTVIATDDRALAGVFYQLDDGKREPLAKGEKSYSGAIDFSSIADGKHRLVIFAVDLAGNETSQILNLKLKAKPFYFLNAHPEKATPKVNVPRPVLQVDVRSKNPVKPEAMKITIDGKEVKDGVVRLQTLLRVFVKNNLSEGEHTAIFTGADINGNKDTYTMKFKVITDFEKDKPQK